MPKVLSEIFAVLPVRSAETANLSRCGMKMPFKYGVLTVVKAVLEKMREEQVRRSLLLQLSKMTGISFARDVVQQVLSHYRRATY
jgi:hypothetical protein